MDERTIIADVDRLVAEEYELRDRAVGQGLDEASRARLRDLETRLDQCWDLLRRRRARREFGQDADTAAVRPASAAEERQE